MTEVKQIYIDTLMFVEKRRKAIFEKGGDRLFDEEVVSMFNKLLKENEQLKRTIKRNTFNKIRVEDILDCAKYDKFYKNEEAIKSIDWIAEQLGVDLE